MASRLNSGMAAALPSGLPGGGGVAQRGPSSRVPSTMLGSTAGAKSESSRSWRGTVPHPASIFGLIPALRARYRPVVAGGCPVDSVFRPLPAEIDLNTQTRPEAFRLRAGNFNLLVLRLLDHRAEAVLPSLGDQFRKAPGFLRFAPIAIGLGDLDAQPDEVDFRALVEGLHALEIVPIGTTGGSARMRQAAQSAGLPPLPPAGGAAKDAEDEAVLPATPAPE